jgi:hypothetical protein
MACAPASQCGAESAARQRKKKRGNSKPTPDSLVVCGVLSPRMKCEGWLLEHFSNNTSLITTRSHLASGSVVPDVNAAIFKCRGLSI